MDEEYQLPTNTEYREQTNEVREINLPLMGFKLPVYPTAPGQILESLDKYGLSDLLNEQDLDSNGELNKNPSTKAKEVEFSDLVDESGEIGFNRFMRDVITPQAATDKTNMDVIHWGNDDVKNDDDVKDFDLSQLQEKDMGALIRGVMFGDSKFDAEQQLNKFQR